MTTISSLFKDEYISHDSLYITVSWIIATAVFFACLVYSIMASRQHSMMVFKCSIMMAGIWRGVAVVILSRMEIHVDQKSCQTTGYIAGVGDVLWRLVIAGFLTKRTRSIRGRVTIDVCVAIVFTVMIITMEVIYQSFLFVLHLRLFIYFIKIFT